MSLTDLVEIFLVNLKLWGKKERAFFDTNLHLDNYWEFSSLLSSMNELGWGTKHIANSLYRLLFLTFLILKYCSCNQSNTSKDVMSGWKEYLHCYSDISITIYESQWSKIIKISFQRNLSRLFLYLIQKESA